MSGTKIIVGILIALHILPFILTQIDILNYPYIYKSNKKRIVKIGTITNVTANLLTCMVAVQAIFSQNLFWVFKRFFLQEYSYQDIARMALSDIICMLVCLAVVLIGHRLIEKYEKTYVNAFKIERYIIVFSLVAIPIILGYKVSLDGSKKIEICEYCRKTSDVQESKDDSKGNYFDDVSYIVIKNNGVLNYETQNLYLSADDTLVEKDRLSSKVIAPGSEQTFYMDGDSGLDVKKEGGTTVYLLNDLSSVTDQIELPGLLRDESYKKTSSGWEVVQLKSSSSDEMLPPTFSVASGFYDKEFDLVLSANDNQIIYYTLDGSVPTTESSEYSSPIHIYNRSKEKNVFRSIKNVTVDYLENEPEDERVDKAFIIRAMTVNASGQQSKVSSATYFVGLSKYKDKNIISLMADPDDLFGDEGIYVTGSEYDSWYEDHLESIISDQKNNKKENIRSSAPVPNFRKRGDEWERAANFELFKVGEEHISQPVGIRIQGSSSSTRPLKRFSIYSRKGYAGDNFFAESIYENVLSHSVVLREGFLNSFTQALMDGRDIAIQKAMPVTVFLNGEYWYDTYIQEKYSKYYFSQHFDINKENVCFMKIGYEKKMTDEEKELYQESFTDVIESADFSDQKQYEEFCKSVDVQSYIDYSCANIYLGNMDTGDKMNTCIWKSYLKENDEYGDGRWRWALYDMDLDIAAAKRKYGYTTDAEVNSFSDEQPYSGITYDEEPLFSSLKRNSSFCKQFVLTFMDLVNTSFSSENVSGIMSQYGNETIESFDKGFFLNREKYIVPYMAKEFDLSGTAENVVIVSNKPDKKIKINTATPDLKFKETDHTYCWSGKYYTDYPITISASSAGFLYWEIHSEGGIEKYTDTTVEVPVKKGGTQIYAIFE